MKKREQPKLGHFSKGILYRRTLALDEMSIILAFASAVLIRFQATGIMTNRSKKENMAILISVLKESVIMNTDN